MRNQLSRRHAMVTGITLALAAPLSLGSAAVMPVGDDADWPEFQQWVKDAIALDDHYAKSDEIHNAHEAGSPPWDAANREAYFNREDYQDEEMGRLGDIARAMVARPVRTERQFAMLVAIAVWACDKTGPSLAPGESNECFNVGRISIPPYLADGMPYFLLHVMARRAKQILPELPFVLPDENARFAFPARAEEA